MIITENIIINNVVFRKTYSDSEVMIKKIGTDEIYVDAYDLADADFSYEETETLIISDYISE